MIPSQILRARRFISHSLALTDVAANIYHPQLLPELDVHLANASKAGVTCMVVPASDVQSAQVILDRSQQPPLDHRLSIRSTVGIHPYEAGTINNDRLAQNMSQIRDLALQHQDLFVAIGECGLDYSPGFPHSNLQQRIFSAQLDLAIALQKNLYIHVRHAFEDFFNLMDEKENLPPVLVHCFTGNEQELKECIRRNYSISVSGLMCRAEAGKPLRHAVRSNFLPSTQHNHLLMVETDAPYLGFKHCRQGYMDSSPKIAPNVPSSLPLIVAELASLLDTSPEDVARTTTTNASRFFGWR